MSNIGRLTTPSGEGASIEVNETEIIVNKNIKVNGGGYIGYNKEWPNEIVISPDNMDMNSSCVSIYNQQHTSKGQLNLFARNMEDDLACSLKMFYNGRIRYAWGSTRYTEVESWLVGIVSESYTDNYWYRKWSNGILEQGYKQNINITENHMAWLTKDSQVYFGTGVWTYPIPFISEPYIQVSTKDIITGTVCGSCIGDNITSINTNYYVYAGKTGSNIVHIYAYGRWE